MKRDLILSALIFIIISSFGIYVLSSSRNNSKIISPISVKTFAGVITPIISPTPTPTTAPTETPSPSPIPTPTPITAPSSLENLFTRFANEYSVDRQLLERMANCESKMNPGAINRDYAGLFQFSTGLWSSTRTLMNQNPDPNLRLSAEESIKTAAFMVSQGHLNVWPNCNK